MDPAPPVVALDLQAGLTTARQCAEATGRALRERGLDEERVAALEVAVAELATNVAKHGYPDEPGPLSLRVHWDQQGLRIELRDRGVDFDPTRVPPPPEPDPADPSTWPEGGMGLSIARSSCDRMSWRRQGTENRLELFLDLPFVPATPGGR